MLQGLTCTSADDVIAKKCPSSNSGFYETLMLPRKMNNLVKGSIMTSEFQVRTAHEATRVNECLNILFTF